MELALTISRGELRQALDDFVPMRLTFADGADPPWFEIDRILSSTLLPRVGLELVTTARVHYPLPILPDDFTILRAVITVKPAVIDGEGGQVLAFRFDVGDFDLKYVPDFIDRSVALRVNDALRARAALIAWPFARALERSLPLPERLSLVRRARLGPARAHVAVSDDAFMLQLSLPVAFEHEGGSPMLTGSRAERARAAEQSSR